VGLVVCRSRIRFAARSYLPNESMSRFRTLEASVSVVCDGGLSGSWRAMMSFWKFGKTSRMPFSNCNRFSYAR